jgi:hypothetical protein
MQRPATSALLQLRHCAAASAIPHTALCMATRRVHTHRFLLAENQASRSQVSQGQSQGPRTLMEGKPFAELTLVEKVTETSKDVGSAGVVLFGIGIGVAFLLATARELLFAETPDKVFRKTLARISKEEEVRELLGSDIQAPDFFQVKSSTYSDKEHVYLRMEYTVNGTYSRGKVMCEMKKKKSNFDKYTVRYLLVDSIGGIPKRVILEDNRHA